ncbi:MAG: carboxymuconolactone decarboxylase family protein [Vicinamibacteraceae bacterium]|nr:carboxymuconolactone decarboxylase family protein [Vicinamibacteraceae bacterium]
MTQHGRGGAYRRLKDTAPEVVAHYDAMSRAAATAGPLAPADVALVKVAMSVARGSWRGVHAHARKALEAGVAPDALRQVAALAVPAIGLQDALDALRWIDEIIEEHTPPAPLQA